jgi:hypothetical protein
VITKDDKYIDTLFDENDDMEIFGVKEGEEPSSQRSSFRRIEKIYLGEENDSVGTLNSRQNLTRIHENMHPGQTDEQNSLHNQSVGTAASGTAISTSSGTEQSIADLSLTMDKIQLTMQAMSQTQDMIIKCLPIHKKVQALSKVNQYKMSGCQRLLTISHDFISGPSDIIMGLQ